jgi:transcriptional antiterminator
MPGLDTELLGHTVQSILVEGGERKVIFGLQLRGPANYGLDLFNTEFMARRKVDGLIVLLLSTAGLELVRHR